VHESNTSPLRYVTPGLSTAPVRIDKHRTVCAKQQQTKRKAFNVKQQRIQAMGSEAAAFAKSANKTEKRYAKKVEARKVSS
jgi:hypothetical protein